MSLNVGDKVLVSLTDKQRAKYPVRKLAPRWSPAAEITKVLSNGKTYVVRTQEGAEQTVHVTRLLPLTGTLWGKMFPTAKESAAHSARKVEVDTNEPEFIDEDVDWHWEYRKIGQTHQVRPVAEPSPGTQSAKPGSPSSVARSIQGESPKALGTPKTLTRSAPVRQAVAPAVSETLRWSGSPPENSYAF